MVCAREDILGLCCLAAMLCVFFGVERVLFISGSGSGTAIETGASERERERAEKKWLLTTQNDTEEVKQLHYMHRMAEIALEKDN